MNHKLAILAVIGLFAGLLAIPASSMHWTPGDGNPATAAQELGNGNGNGNGNVANVFADDWSPLPATWPFFSGDMPGNGEGPPQDGDEDEDADEPGDAPSCQDDVEDAQDAADGRFCTLQVQDMQCPYDPEFTYTASNGCEISELRQRGWTAADTGVGDGDDGDDATPPGEDEDADEEPDDDTGDDGTGDGDGDTGDSGVTEERHATPAPEPEAVGEDWLSYPNSRDHMPNPETAGYDPSIKVCAVMVNQNNEVIRGTTVPDTTIEVMTNIPRFTDDTQPVTFTLPLTQEQDLVGTSPDYVEGDGMLDAECGEYHNLPEQSYSYSAPTISGADAGQVEFVGVTEYWDATGQGNPFSQQVYSFGANELSDGHIPALEAGNYEQQHAEIVYVFRLK